MRNHNMASLEPSLDFVDQPPGEFFCPITEELLLEPHQTLCCGHYLSQDTVNRIQGDEKPCPMCRKQPLKTLPDKAFRRKVRVLKVYCSNKYQGCEWTGELGELDGHVNAKCQYAQVDCEFSYAGCKTKVQRRYMQAHLKESMEEHLLLVSSDLKREKQLRTEQIDLLFKAFGALPSMFTPPVFTMPDFKKHKRDGDLWYSPPFYSHAGGHKMCLSVTANGWRDAKGTHVSVAVHMVRGEYDDYLRWPFRGDITVQLLNQRRDGEHVEKTIHFDDRVSDEVAGRVVGKERASSGRGFDKVIAHTALGYNATQNTEYLNNDHLKFQVTNIVVKSTN